MQAEILHGLYLMMVGMSFVLAFLTLVVISLKLLAYVAPKISTAPLSEPHKHIAEDTALQAAISTAVHTYRKRHRSKD